MDTNPWSASECKSTSESKSGGVNDLQISSGDAIKCSVTRLPAVLRNAIDPFNERLTFDKGPCITNASFFCFSGRRVKEGRGAAASAVGGGATTRDMLPDLVSAGLLSPLMFGMAHDEQKEAFEAEARRQMLPLVALEHTLEDYENLAEINTCLKWDVSPEIHRLSWEACGGYNKIVHASSSSPQLSESSSSFTGLSSSFTSVSPFDSDALIAPAPPPSPMSPDPTSPFPSPSPSPSESLMEEDEDDGGSQISDPSDPSDPSAPAMETEKEEEEEEKEEVKRQSDADGPEERSDGLKERSLETVASAEVDDGLKERSDGSCPRASPPIISTADWSMSIDDMQRLQNDIELYNDPLNNLKTTLECQRDGYMMFNTGWSYQREQQDNGDSKGVMYEMARFGDYLLENRLRANNRVFPIPGEALYDFSIFNTGMGIDDQRRLRHYLHFWAVHFAPIQPFVELFWRGMYRYPCYCSGFVRLGEKSSVKRMSRLGEIDASQWATCTASLYVWIDISLSVQSDVFRVVDNEDGQTAKAIDAELRDRDSERYTKAMKLHPLFIVFETGDGNAYGFRITQQADLFLHASASAYAPASGSSSSSSLRSPSLRSSGSSSSSALSSLSSSASASTAPTAPATPFWSLTKLLDALLQEFDELVFNRIFTGVEYAVMFYHGLQRWVNSSSISAAHWVLAPDFLTSLRIAADDPYKMTRLFALDGFVSDKFDMEQQYALWNSLGVAFDPKVALCIIRCFLASPTGLDDTSALIRSHVLLHYTDILEKLGC